MFPSSDKIIFHNLKTVIHRMKTFQDNFCFLNAFTAAFYDFPSRTVKLNISAFLVQCKKLSSFFLSSSFTVPATRHLCGKNRPSRCKIEGRECTKIDPCAQKPHPRKKIYKGAFSSVFKNGAPLRFFFIIRCSF